MKNCESKKYSQNGEDGIISHIFNHINTTNKIAVEFGVGDGAESNTRALTEQDWKCYWFDGLEANNKPNTVIFKQAWLTADNIVDEFQSLNIPIEFDILSIDVDGNDYHLREALREYRPRVIIQEYNGCFDPTEEYIMPRNDNYIWKLWEKNFGASLLSLTKQANRFGYDLVYCEKQGVNAFFIRHDVNCFPTLTPQEAWKPLWWANQI